MNRESKPEASGQDVTRRHFAGYFAGVFAAGLLGLRTGPDGLIGLPSPTPRASLQQTPRIDPVRLGEILDGLRRFGGTPDGGTTRPAYSDADLQAREYVGGLMERAGLTVEIDLAGNLIGRKAGSADLRPLGVGSHIDSVPGGGSFDGQVGSAGALEVALSLADHDIELRHPLEVLIFQNEEAGKTGSRALVGRVEPFELQLTTASGYTIGDGIRRLGGDPDRLNEAQREAGSIAGFLELHIEQGAILDRRGIDIGVVEGIVGIRRWNVTVTGMANHAGTTPMDQRRDALVAAAGFIRTVNRTALEMEGRQVATVGRIEAVPGAPNVVPGEVRTTLEIRDLSMEKIQQVFERIREASEASVAEEGATIRFEQFYESLAAPTDRGFRDLIEQSADRYGFSSLRMPSGAGHDAQSMAELGPVGMIFVPSDEGISHSPREHTSIEKIARGADVLLGSLLALDEAL